MLAEIPTRLQSRSPAGPGGLRRPPLARPDPNPRTLQPDPPRRDQTPPAIASLSKPACARIRSEFSLGRLESRSRPIQAQRETPAIGGRLHSSPKRTSSCRRVAARKGAPVPGHPLRWRLPTDGGLQESRNTSRSPTASARDRSNRCSRGTWPCGRRFRRNRGPGLRPLARAPSWRATRRRRCWTTSTSGSCVRGGS